MPSYQYRKSRCGDKTVVRSSHLYNGISYPGCQWHVEAVVGVVGPTNSCSCSTHSASRNDTAMLQIFQKLQCLADTSVVTMICTGFICVLTRNRSYDNPFVHIIIPINCHHFQQPLPISASVTPVHLKVGAPEEGWKL